MIIILITMHLYYKFLKNKILYNPYFLVPSHVNNNIMMSINDGDSVGDLLQTLY
jgi:hypothetical protein